MLSRTQLEPIFTSEYKTDNWLEIIKSISREPVIYKKPNPLELDKDIAKTGYELGNFETSDGMLIGLYEIELKDNIQIERNRVGLRNLLRKYYRQVDGCFAVYYTGDKWRFSYISETSVKDAEGNRVESKTEPKRYTYVLGEGETVRTAVDRFDELFRSNKRLEDIKTAFSIEGVTDEFYDELRKVYHNIQGYIEGIDTAENKKIFAQLIINRLIFLKFLEKKGWLFVSETDSIEHRRKYFHVKRDALGSQNQWNNFFIHLFFKGLNQQSLPGTVEFTDAMRELIGYVPYLNGGLFEESKLWKEKKVEIDNRLFFEVFDNLLNRFNFTVAENTPLDIEVALNPDLLGYAYEEMIAERHGQGAYYTHPTEVGLMCRESLKTYLNEHTEIEYNKLIELVDEWSPDNLTETEAFDIYSKLLYVKILDPAVGSGAYPVRMMQELVQIYYALSQKLSSGTLRKIMDNKLIDPGSFYDLKRSIIENNLYGVDIDHFAVEIAKLRFWLSLVVDFNLPVNSPKDLANIPPLPNLDFKLKTGDSLLSIPGKVKKRNMFGEEDAYVNLDLYLMDESIGDMFSKDIVRELKDLKRTYFNFEEERKTNKELLKITKDDLREQISKKEKEIFANMGFRMETDPERLNHIIWQVHFAELFDGENFGFDICIANPPYLRQEKINEMFEIFKSGVTKDDLVRAYEKLYEDLKLKIDKKSDLYVYFYLRCLYLLKEKGVLCFICSNSWLDVGYGKSLQEVLLRKSRIIGIYDNSAKRSFAKADVNTTINVFVKDNSIDFAQNKRILQTDNVVKFVSFKKDFEVAAIPDSFKEIKNSSEIIISDNFRSYAITQKELMQGGLNESEKYEGDKWGSKFLRAPDVFFIVLEKGKDKFLKLDEIADVKFGVKTGINDFFYLDDTKINKWQIENEFLRPVIKSPRECKNITVDLESLKYKIFMCHKNKQELQNTYALKYINWGETQMTEDGKLWPQVSSIVNRANWYDIPEPRLAKVFWVMTLRERLGTFYCATGIHVDARFYSIYTKNPLEIFYLLNCTITHLFVELLGRAYGGGGGPLDIKVYEVQLINILNPDFLPIFKKPLFHRYLNNIFVECGFDENKKLRSQIPKPLPDRKELDDIIFNAIDLTQDERNEVYWSLCELVQNRLNKAKSV